MFWLHLRPLERRLAAKKWNPALPLAFVFYSVGALSSRMKRHGVRARWTLCWGSYVMTFTLTRSQAVWTLWEVLERHVLRWRRQSAKRGKIFGKNRVHGSGMVPDTRTIYGALKLFWRLAVTFMLTHFMLDFSFLLYRPSPGSTWMSCKACWWPVAFIHSAWSWIHSIQYGYFDSFLSLRVSSVFIVRWLRHYRQQQFKQRKKTKR